MYNHNYCTLNLVILLPNSDQVNDNNEYQLDQNQPKHHLKKQGRRQEIIKLPTQIQVAQYELDASFLNYNNNNQFHSNLEI